MIYVVTYRYEGGCNSWPCSSAEIAAEMASVVILENLHTHPDYDVADEVFNLIRSRDHDRALTRWNETWKALVPDCERDEVRIDQTDIRDSSPDLEKAFSQVEWCENPCTPEEES